MDNTEKEILNRFKQYKGQIVLPYFDQPKQLIAVIDGRDDYYWVFYDGKNINFHSCVGSFIPLKGAIPDKEYNELRRLANLNYDTLSEEHCIDSKKRILTEILQKSISEICLDLC